MDWLGRVLCVNANSGPDQEKPARNFIDDTLTGLIKEHDIGLALFQEYRFKGGSSFSKFSPLRDLLPGGWRRWKVAQLEFEGAGMVPLILWDDTQYDGTAVKLAHSGPPPTPGSVRPKAAVEEPFAGRYTAVLLSSKVSPGKELGAKVLVVSYHGQFLMSKDNPVELSEDHKLRNACGFLELVGSAAARLGVPALVGGDWSTSFGFETVAVPTSDDWTAQLRPISSYHPSELACYRYRNSKAPVDFLAVINPVERHFTLEASGVTALSLHPDLQQHFDHDPLLASFVVSAGEEAPQPPAPLCAAANPLQGPTHRSARRSTPRGAAHPSPPPTPSDPALPHSLGDLDHQNEQLLRELSLLRKEAGKGVGGPEGGSKGSGGEAEDGAGSGEEGSGADELAQRLFDELALVKEAAGKLLQEKNDAIALLQAKLRTISEEASDAASMPLAESVPAAFASPAKNPGGRQLTPPTPEQSQPPAGNDSWRSNME